MLEELEAHFAATIQYYPPPQEYIDLELAIAFHCKPQDLDDMAEEDLQLYRQIMQSKLDSGRLKERQNSFYR